MLKHIMVGLPATLIFLPKKYLLYCRLNEDMMESLFGCNSANSVPKEATRKPVLPPAEQDNKVLDPKKSQNIAIMLRALNVTKDEVSEALLNGM